MNTVRTLLDNLGLSVTADDNDTITVKNKISGATIIVKESGGQLRIDGGQSPSMITFTTDTTWFPVGSKFESGSGLKYVLSMIAPGRVTFICINDGCRINDGIDIQGMYCTKDEILKILENYNADITYIPLNYNQNQVIKFKE